MLQSCSPGLVVVNIDNGFGAACAASLIAMQQQGIKKWRFFKLIIENVEKRILIVVSQKDFKEVDFF